METSKVARIREVRDIVNNGLRLCQRFGRVVMLGRDIGGVVFPDTPYKFFLDASEKIREQRHRQTTQTSGAAKRDRNDASQVVFVENALLIDTGKTSPEEVRGIIVMDLLWRTAETKTLEKRRTSTE
jgi:cytidylate kinase